MMLCDDCGDSSYNMIRVSTQDQRIRSVGSKVTCSVILKFVLVCLAVADAYEAPTFLAIALCPIFRKNVNKITARLMYDVGEQEECISGHERDGVDALPDFST
jgi:hypothetical protein